MAIQIFSHPYPNMPIHQKSSDLSMLIFYIRSTVPLATVKFILEEIFGVMQ